MVDILYIKLPFQFYVLVGNHSENLNVIFQLNMDYTIKEYQAVIPRNFIMRYVKVKEIAERKYRCTLKMHWSGKRRFCCTLSGYKEDILVEGAYDVKCPS